MHLSSIKSVKHLESGLTPKWLELSKQGALTNGLNFLSRFLHLFCFFIGLISLSL